MNEVIAIKKLNGDWELVTVEMPFDDQYGEVALADIIIKDGREYIFKKETSSGRLLYVDSEFSLLDRDIAEYDERSLQEKYEELEAISQRQTRAINEMNEALNINETWFESLIKKLDEKGVRVLVNDDTHEILFQDIQRTER